MTTEITYATMSADDPNLHRSFDQGLEAAQNLLGRDHPCFIDGEEIWTDDLYEERSPIDSEILVGRYAQTSPIQVGHAVKAARQGIQEWASQPWPERVEIFRQAAERLDKRWFELSALLTLEVGKSRLEALGDVAETAAFFRYYADEMERNQGFLTQLGDTQSSERNWSVRLPYGVWGVIAPFNFPMALTGGPSSAALIAGNTVVLKPSNQGALAALELYRILCEAGLPPSALQLVTGGDETGAALVDHQGVDGITFTGSYQVGMEIYQKFGDSFPKPVVCEMGGKNPAIVTGSADPDLAAEGVARAAFGFSGQKCSACSRVLVDSEVYPEFTQRLVGWAKDLSFGDPRQPESFSGPVIDQVAVKRYHQALDEAQKKGEVLAGEEKVWESGLSGGNYVPPAVVTVPDQSWVWKQELFVPFVAVRPVDSLEEAIQLANDTAFGLTAGIYSCSPTEVDAFFDRIQAGVVYANRRAGATTGAWPNVQSFGGWKGSGSTGVGGGGPWYLGQFMREQSRTLIQA